jgi:DNA (cytosine-5)-methyltransferase 1
MGRKKFLAIDVFSGCGGLTQGLKNAGFKIIGAIENDALAAETYRLNHSYVCLWEKDIRYVSGLAVLRKLNLNPGDLDLLAGCPPCQGFSSLRTLNGNKKIKDSRNDLIKDFIRLVRVLKPKTVMMENVKGLKKDKRLNFFCNSLKKFGYDFSEPSILNAANYGVPQRRERLIVMAGRFGTIPYAPPSGRTITVYNKIGKMRYPHKNNKDFLHRNEENRSKQIKKIIKMIPKDGGCRRDLGKRFSLECHKKCDGFKDVYGRMSWDSPAPTITGGCINPSKGRFLHPTHNRTITLREASLLQSFPRRYKFSLKQGRFAIAQMIGNALPPEFIRRQAIEIDNYLKLHRREYAGCR